MFCVCTLVSFLFCIPLHRWLLLSMQPPRNQLPNVHALLLIISSLLKLIRSIMTAIRIKQSSWKRVVQLESLESTFIPEVFKERTWTKFLNPAGVVYSEIIKEFFSNAAVEGDRIECWLRHTEFLIAREIIQDFLEVRPPSQPILVQYDDRLGSIAEMVRILGGSPKKNSMNTIPFSLEMRTLAYVMIHNLYPITNLTTLLAPRTMFLYDLFTHKEIDIYGHILYLLEKSIMKYNSRTIMPFPSFIMGLIAKERLKIPSGPTIVQRDYPIGAHTLTRSTTHIKGSKTGVHTIPQARVEDEGGDTEEEIKRFTTAPEPSDQPSAQPSSSVPAGGSDRLDRILARVYQLYTMLDSHVQRTTDQFAYVQGQITALSSQIEELSVDHSSDSESERFQPFGHFDQKEGENFEEELRKSLHSVRGSIGLGLETLVIGSQAVCLCLFLAFITTGFMFMLLLLLFKTSIYSVFNFNLYSVCFVYLIALQHLFVLLRYCQYVLSTSLLCPSRILFLDAYTLCILHWSSVGHAIDPWDCSLLHCVSG